MKNKITKRSFLGSLTLIIGGMFSLVSAQYFSFDTGGVTGYPYQQGCSENLKLMVTTEGDLTGAGAGLITLKLDPTHFEYETYTGSIDPNLFSPSTASFRFYTGLPVRKDGAFSILYIDRNLGGGYFKGDALYGTLHFVPKYDPADYTGNFVIIYNGNETVTSLSYLGSNIINSGHQYSRLTGAYYVAQKPCVDDTTDPAYHFTVPAGSNKISYLSGITLELTDDNGSSSINVPYVRTGDLPGLGERTGNARSLNNQYGINFSTFELFMSGNGNTRYFTGGMFSPAGTLSYSMNGKTRQYRDKDYTIYIDSSELFDYGIEKLITITGKVYDRKGNMVIIGKSFNPPAGPTLIPGSADPANGQSGLGTTIPVILGIQDERAGVDSGTIVITLSGMNGTAYGPYTFTGGMLNLSGVAGDALLPDYYITITGHTAFPTSGHISLRRYAEDVNGNIGSGGYMFHTAPSCTDRGCCPNVYLQTGTNTPFSYSGFILNISGGLNASFTGYGFTGVIDCGLGGQTALNIYKGIEELSGSASFVSFHDAADLVFSGDATVKAVLSGNTIYLQSSNLFTFIIKAFPSNRVYQATNNSNTGVLRIYSETGLVVATSAPFILNDAGTGEVTITVPPGTYYAAFRGQSHLASYLSGMTVATGTGNVFDFTTGDNLFGTQNLDDVTDDGKRYQTAGDLINSAGQFDHYINGNDLTVIIGQAGEFPQAAGVGNPRNLNGDDEINASDIGIIGTNFMKQDPFFQDPFNPGGNRFVR